MIQASIDIGTNTVMLLVANVDDSDIEVLCEKQQLPRLGKGVDKDRKLHPASQAKVLDVLKSYKVFLESEYQNISITPVITATSAVRDAANREDFMNAVEQETGWRIQLLSGRQEAQTTFSGALSVLKGMEVENAVVLDIGGGSTEIAWGTQSNLMDGTSLNIGSVRYTERFFVSDPPKAVEIEKARHSIRQQLATVSVPFDSFEAIGVAGTVTSVAAICKGLSAYDPGELNGYFLRKKCIEQYITEFSSLTSQQIEEDHPVFLKGRGEVILAGLLILDEFLAYTSTDGIVVSTGGIRHGILLKKK